MYCIVFLEGAQTYCLPTMSFSKSLACLNTAFEFSFGMSCTKLCKSRNNLAYFTCVDNLLLDPIRRKIAAASAARPRARQAFPLRI